MGIFDKFGLDKLVKTVKEVATKENLEKAVATTVAAGKAAAEKAAPYVKQAKDVVVGEVSKLAEKYNQSSAEKKEDATPPAAEEKPKAKAPRKKSGPKPGAK